MSQHILVIEDEPGIALFLKRGLTFEGYQVTVAESGETALKVMLEQSVQLVILDVNLPGIDGLEVLRRLRAAGEQVPVLMLSSRESVPDKVAGLNAGADDYLGKPFALEELVARLQVLLRRQEQAPPSLVTFADLQIDTTAHEVRRSGRSITLTAKEFEVLLYFVNHPRQVLTRQQLYDAIWGYDFGADSNVIEVFLRNIRTKLEADGEPRLLHTIRGVGYVLREP